jgi:spectinomycin phosphotransferase
MKEPPKLAKATIITTLQENYGIIVKILTFLPLGADSGSAVYRVQAAGGATYFLKVRAGAGFGEPSLAVPRYLYEHSVPHILAPLPTTDGRLWAGVNGFALSLYLYIDGRNAVEAGLSLGQWHALGKTLKQIHTAPLTPELLRILPRERYIPWRRELIPELERVINQKTFGNDAESELAGYWRGQQAEIRELVDRTDALGRQLRNTALPHVLCHADLHTWNVLVDTNHQFWLVDWDETILAPKERDLMFVVAGIGSDLVDEDETACFLQGYGDTEIDRQALTYYRYAWAVQDIAAYGEWIFFLPDLSLETRLDAVRGFKKQFEPGNIVDIAFASGR